MIETTWDRRVQRAFHASTGEDEVVVATTGDGVRLALSHYRPASPADRASTPIVLCHGLAANRFGFDLAPSRSLARWLASRGRDVWVLELRGSGRSNRPSARGPLRWGFTFDDYLLHDLPTAFAKVRERTGASSLDFVGHSMGGLLGYAHIGSSDNALRSLVAVGSSLDYYDSPSDFHLLKHLAPVARRLPMIPVGILTRLGAPLAGRFDSAHDRFNFVVENVEPALLRRVNAVAVHDVSGPLLAQLATAFDPPGLLSYDGSVCYADTVDRATVPVLAIAGDADRQCAPSAAEHTLRRTKHPASALHVFGREHGHPTSYGHFDLLIGRRVREEVFPVIERFLEARDAEG